MCQSMHNGLEMHFHQKKLKAPRFPKQRRPAFIVWTVNFQWQHLCRPALISAVTTEAVPVVFINLLYCFFAHPSVLVFFPKAQPFTVKFCFFLCAVESHYGFLQSFEILRKPKFQKRRRAGMDTKNSYRCTSAFSSRYALIAVSFYI